MNERRVAGCVVPRPNSRLAAAICRFSFQRAAAAAGAPVLLLLDDNIEVP
jgi:hypothetical protein